jgi:hypothetical protein
LEAVIRKQQSGCKLWLFAVNGPGQNLQVQVPASCCVLEAHEKFPYNTTKH